MSKKFFFRSIQVCVSFFIVCVFPLFFPVQTLAQVTPPIATPTPDTNVVDHVFLFLVDPLNVNTQEGQLNTVPPGVINTTVFTNPGNIISFALKYFLFPLAGLILFIMIFWGGFEMMAGANDTKAQENGQQRITAAIIGFLLLFISYWIASIVQTITGVNVIG